MKERKRSGKYSMISGKKIKLKVKKSKKDKQVILFIFHSGDMIMSCVGICEQESVFLFVFIRETKTVQNCLSSSTLHFDVNALTISFVPGSSRLSWTVLFCFIESNITILLEGLLHLRLSLFPHILLLHCVWPSKWVQKPVKQSWIQRLTWLTGCLFRLFKFNSSFYIALLDFLF